jgi:hypothetical protein
MWRKTAKYSPFGLGHTNPSWTGIADHCDDERVFIVGIGQNCNSLWLPSRELPLQQETNPNPPISSYCSVRCNPQAWAVSPEFGECKNAGQLRCLRNVARFPCQVRICEKSADIVHYRPALAIDALMREWRGCRQCRGRTANERLNIGQRQRSHCD